MSSSRARVRYTVEGLTPGISPCTLRANAVGEMWPRVRMISATMARRWGVIRRPRARRMPITSPPAPSLTADHPSIVLHLQNPGRREGPLPRRPPWDGAGSGKIGLPWESDAMGEFIRLEVEGPVATIRLDRPPANAISRQVSDELHDSVAESGRRDDIRAVVVWGGPHTFAAGADLKEIVQ